MSKVRNRYGQKSSEACLLGHRMHEPLDRRFRFTPEADMRCGPRVGAKGRHFCLRVRDHDKISSAHGLAFYSHNSLHSVGI
jgi:hypothetical protein